MSLPMEVFEDILSRLPVKPLLRFRCVSPQWRDLIDSNHFAKLHLARSIEADSHLNAILCSEPRPYAAKLEPSIRTLETTELHHHPLRDEVESEIQVWGSCHGLICLSNEWNTIALWNPSTREFKKLPHCRMESIYHECGDAHNYIRRNKYGLGYDQDNDDYKVLNIMNVAEKISGKVVMYRVKVYSLKANAWRDVKLHDEIHKLPYIERTPGHFAAGSLHWVMGQQIDRVGMIVAFPLSSEEWHTLPIPDVGGEVVCSLSAGCFRDSIYLSANHLKGYMDIWVMKEYGVESSWSKLFSLRPNISRPVYFPKRSDKVFMQHHQGLIWFDVQSSRPWYESVRDTGLKYMKNIEVRGMKKILRVAVYMDSLVRLSGFGRLREEKKPKRKYAIKKNICTDFSRFAATMSIPVEVLENILSRLPVESLLRFRCVSSLWCALIDSPRFVKLHLSRSINTETNLSIVLFNPGLQIAKFEPSVLSTEAIEPDHHPLRHNEFALQVWGSCNGLLCLGNISHTVVLWNPSTRKSITLPFSDYEFKPEDVEISAKVCSRGFGFGYDSFSDDYKVVRIKDLLGHDNYVVAYEVQVYSLKTNSWHRVDNFVKMPYIMREPGQFACGSLHWVMAKEIDKGGMIVAFDLHSETCRIVPVPRFKDTRCELSVERFNETISLVYIHRFGFIDIWVMKEYGVQESWTKLFTLNNPCFTRPFYFPKNDGGVCMQHAGKLFRFNTTQDDGKNIEVRGLKKFVRVEVFTASLIPLDDAFVKTNDKKKPKEKKKTDMAGFLSKGFKLKL